MSMYTNNIQLSINEVAILNFGENSQMSEGSVAKVAMLYDTLKQLHILIGNAIEQHDKKLGELQRTKANMN